MAGASAMREHYIEIVAKSRSKGAYPRLYLPIACRSGPIADLACHRYISCTSIQFRP
jgi:hypothetical protein